MEKSVRTFYTHQAIGSANLEENIFKQEPHLSHKMQIYSNAIL